MSTREDWEKELNDLPFGSGGFSPDTAQKVKDRVAGGGYRKRRRRLAAAIAVSTVLLLLGTSFWLNPSAQEKTAYEQVPLDEQKEVKLKVQYWDTRSFLSQVGYPYMKKYPNTSFEVAATLGKPDFESYVQWVRENNPDVLQIPLEYIDDLANAGMILPLDEWAERDREDMGRMHQPVVDLIREAGNGKLYGLANQFDVKALVYNKELFEEKGVAPPTDNMTWDEVLQLASLFAGDRKDGQPVYGLSFGWQFNPLQGILHLGYGEGLRMAGPDGHPSLNTPPWHAVWTQVFQGMRDGSISSEGLKSEVTSWTDTTVLEYDPFLRNRAAMSIRGVGGWRVMTEAKNRGLTEGLWGAATLPGSASAPGTVRDYDLPFIYAINTESPHQPDAWKLIKYMLSEEWAARNTGDNYYGLYTVRPKGLPDQWDAFYRAKPDVVSVVDAAEDYQQTAYRAIIPVWHNKGESLAKKAFFGTITIEQALAELQKEAENAVRSLSEQK